MSRVVLRLAGSDEEVELTFMETGPPMVEGTEGALHWRARTAAFVTDAGTYWAV